KDFFVLCRCQVVEEIMYRVNMFSVDNNFVVQVGRSGQPRVSDVTDEVATLHLLSNFYIESVHVRITRPVAEAVIDFNHLSIPAELYTNSHHLSICGCVYRCSDLGREIDTHVALLYLVDRMEPWTKSGSQGDKLFIGYRLNSGDCCKQFLFVLCELYDFI